MLKQTSRCRWVLSLVVGLSLLCSGAYAQGDRNRTDRGSSTRGDPRGNMRKDDHKDNRDVHQNDSRSRYHYRDGRWYSRGWFGWEFAVSALAIGAFVESLPPSRSVVIVDNNTYYYDNTRYYRQLPDGAYVVVQAPR